MALELKPSKRLKPQLYSLIPTERARLLDRMIPTLDADPEVEEVWAAEVERRQTEVENGTVSLLPGPQTLTRLKAEFE